MRTQIIVIDDHELIRAGLKLRLDREEGFKVVADAADAASACSMVAEKSPDIVVMDISLPGEDGLSATRTLKARWPKTRVLPDRKQTGEHCPGCARRGGRRAGFQEGGQ